MNNLFTELTDEEFDHLDHFLLYRIDEDADTLDKDEGVLGMSELDGLLTAVVSGPVMVPPSQWLPAVWGDFEPLWESEAEFREIFSLMMRHMNGIAETLNTHLEAFEPVFLERAGEDDAVMIVDEWCEGYVRGVALAAHEWQLAGEEMAVLLSPVLAFTEAGNWSGHEQGFEEIEKRQRAIAPHVREIYRYWLARRGEEVSASQPHRRTAPRVGRNDPCPCGSGKKFKKCCLH